ncbi:hypothetical protein HAX54_051120 [Datura stramonium]|uniref:Uncharacterized protein n=1 Tax=Datura stramonium TaxID=4076 RepID=A0ABS8SXA0_DATST|nr:hypothetical protein [Datura stramonium]
MSWRSLPGLGLVKILDHFMFHCSASAIVVDFFSYGHCIHDDLSLLLDLNFSSAILVPPRHTNHRGGFYYVAAQLHEERREMPTLLRDERRKAPSCLRNQPCDAAPLPARCHARRAKRKTVERAHKASRRPSSARPGTSATRPGVTRRIENTMKAVKRKLVDASRSRRAAVKAL